MMMVLLLYCRFCKNAIFQNFGNIMFFRQFAFFLPPTFLSRLLTNLHQNWHEFPIWYAIYTEARFLGKVQKPGHNSQKTLKKRSFFTHESHDETVKVFFFNLFGDYH